jgi:hypothetical protein
MSQLNLHTLQNNINLYHFNITHKKDILLILLQYLLPNRDIFLSFTINDDEISIICDTFIEDYIQNLDYIVLKNYRCIKINDEYDNINYIGVVKKISTLLTEVNVPILYINSFNNNYIILEEKYLEKAINTLHNDFIIH